jgi:hypothetical protein
MGTDIKKAKESVSKITKQSKGSKNFFRVILYEDHCDSELIRTYPSGEGFTENAA